MRKLDDSRIKDNMTLTSITYPVSPATCLIENDDLVQSRVKSNNLQSVQESYWLILERLICRFATQGALLRSDLCVGVDDGFSVSWN